MKFGTRKGKSVVICVPPEVLEKIDVYCAKHSLSRSGFLRFAALRMIDEDK